MSLLTLTYTYSLPCSVVCALSWVRGVYTHGFCTITGLKITDCGDIVLTCILGYKPLTPGSDITEDHHPVEWDQGLSKNVF